MSTTPDRTPDPAVEHLLDTGTPPVAVLSLEPKDLDGYSVDDLSDYLDAGMTPRNPVIDISPACQIALAALARLKALTATFLEEEAAAEAPRDESWMASLLQNISLECQTGRQIPYRTAELRTAVVITEGAVRGLIRAAGDTVDGILVGRSALSGDVTVLDEPIAVDVDATIVWRNNIPDAAEQLRHAIEQTLASNTDLTVVGITVTITDVHVTPSEEY